MIFIENLLRCRQILATRLRFFHGMLTIQSR